MVLVDTSIWINHFRKSESRLIELLEQGDVVTHPFITGELACGNMKNRKQIISLLHALPSAPKASDDEILFFIDRHSIMGRGIGLIDAHLLASCKLAHCILWSTDKRLLLVANDMGLVCY